MASASDHNRHLLISYPRTVSNLLLKNLALSTQENVHITCQGSGYQGGNGYFFMRNQMLKGTIGKLVNQWFEEDMKLMTESYQSCVDEVEAYVQDAKIQGKIAFVKEHAHFINDPSAEARFLSSGNESSLIPLTIALPDSYDTKGTRTTSNNTIFPGEFLKTWTATFLIRHPALVFPPYYRASQAFFNSSPAQLDLFIAFT